jgi:hypothetical protein
MTANFLIYQNYAIQLGDKHLDLHNNFDFKGFSFDIDTRKLTLNWNGKNADWVPTDNPSTLSITVFDVDYLKVIPRNVDTPLTEDNCLSDFTYYSSLERQDDECVLMKETPSNDDDLIFKFESEQIIRVKGSKIEACIE